MRRCIVISDKMSRRMRFSHFFLGEKLDKCGNECGSGTAASIGVQ